MKKILLILFLFVSSDLFSNERYDLSVDISSVKKSYMENVKEIGSMSEDYSLEDKSFILREIIGKYIEYAEALKVIEELLFIKEHVKNEEALSSINYFVEFRLGSIRDRIPLSLERINLDIRSTNRQVSIVLLMNLKKDLKVLGEIILRYKSQK